MNGHQQITGAHIVAIGAQHAIASVDLRALFRAALAACASAVVLGHYVPRHIMAILFPLPFCSRRGRERRFSPGEPSRMAT